MQSARTQVLEAAAKIPMDGKLAQESNVLKIAGWFDLYRVDRLLQGDVDHEGVTASKDYLNSLVEAELQAGMPPKRIVVGGFSQV